MGKGKSVVISRTKTFKDIAGLILAAGKSERMGRPKPLLPLEGETFLSRIIRNVEDSRLTEWIVVLGHRHEEILAQAKMPANRTILNADYELGQLSSLKCGLGALNWQKLDGVMVILSDHPLISTAIINVLVENFSAENGLIVIPTFQGKRGHPVIFGKSLFAELSSAPLETGAKSVIRAHQRDILHIPVEEEGILVDVDTQSDYAKLLWRFTQQDTR